MSLLLALAGGEPPPITGTGAAVKSLSATASGAAKLIFNATMAGTKSLSAVASGTASLRFNGSGSPSKTLSRSASGTASQRFNGAGTPSKTLSAVASGTAVLRFNGAGAPSKTLSASASGAAKLIFNATMAGSKTLDAVGSGTATMTPEEGAVTPPRVVYGWWETKKKREKLPIELVLEAEETPDPVFGPLPELIPSSRIAWEKLKTPEVQFEDSKEQAAYVRRKRQEQQLITMILAGAA
jgi:hypothetical protein